MVVKITPVISGMHNISAVRDIFSVLVFQSLEYVNQDT